MGYMILTFPLGAGAENGAELGAENLAFLQAETDGAPAQKGVHLDRELEMGKEFVAAQIQRADDDRMGFQGGGQLAIDLELLLLGGQGFAVDEQVFGAEQPNALGAVKP